MKFRIRHLTRYEYTEPASLCHDLAHLRPRTLPGQRCLESRLSVRPFPAVHQEHRDLFGNRVDYFAIQQAHQVLEVEALSEVERLAQPIPEAEHDIPWEQARDWARSERSPMALEARLFQLESPAIATDADLIDYARPSFPAGRPLLEAIADLVARIHGDFAFDPHFSNVATPLREVLEHRRGVCQDFAHLAIACLRGQGLPARYVSGYLETLPPPGQPRLQGADASHAWFAVCLPHWGWVDFDPTNDQVPSDRHITTAIGRDYNDVTPLQGVVYGGGEHRLTVAVDVERIEEKPPSLAPEC